MKFLIVAIAIAAAIGAVLLLRGRSTAGAAAPARPLPEPAKSGPRYRPFSPSPAIEPAISADGRGEPGSFDRVSDAVAILDISPDGKEALTLHDKTSVTLFDIESGRALKTWPEAAPADWLDGNISGASAVARRLLLDWSGSDGGGYEVVLIDLEKGTATRIYETYDETANLDAIAMSADGRFAAGFVSYGKSHAAFELDEPLQASAEEERWGMFGDIVIEAETWGMPIAMSADGRWLACEHESEEVLVLELAEKPADRDELEPWQWPDYREHMTVVGDAGVASIAFSPDDDRLLVLQNDGGLIVADLGGRDFEMSYPFPATDDEDVQYAYAQWLPGRDQAMAVIRDPDPKLFLIDLAEGKILREQSLAEDIARRITISPTGAFALISDGSGGVRISPLPVSD